MKTFHREELPQIELDSIMTDGGRFYITPSGDQYPSITTVLSAMQSAEKKQVLENWRARVGEQEANKVSRQATSRGTGMHTICENYTSNFPNPMRGHMPTAVEMFKRIQHVLDDRVGTIYGNEIALFSNKLKAAGRTDMLAQFDGIRTVVDFKTSKREKKESWITDYFLQSTAYAIMIEEMYGDIKVPQIAIVIAVEDGETSNNQVFVKRTADYREQVFQIFSQYHANRIE
jgi:genome maintenance exonuclease 1